MNNIKQIKFIIKEIPYNSVPNERIDFKYKPLKVMALSDLESMPTTFDEPEREYFRLEYFAIGKEYREAFYITPDDKKAFESIILQFIRRDNIRLLEEVTREVMNANSQQEAQNVAYEILKREKNKLKELEDHA